MSNGIRATFLRELADRYGPLQKLGASHSLYDLQSGRARVYIRYSKVHNKSRTFYGLREEDLRQLGGHAAVICFLWDGQTEPLLIPYSEYEEVLQSLPPARDGQYKVQIYLNADSTELYLPTLGRFRAERHFGWNSLDALINATAVGNLPDLSHSQVQTLLGAIGVAKSYDVWIPAADRERLDWSFVDPFEYRARLPDGFERVARILQEVDVIWIRPGSNEPRALFEVEHSTPIYSGLLRFNDIHLAVPALRPTFSIVANEGRRSIFARQLGRPTFQASGLSQLCTFLEYIDVFGWYHRMKSN